MASRLPALFATAIVALAGCGGDAARPSDGRG
jgi:hypothetical protein